jgi:hypothetical protein
VDRASVGERIGVVLSSFSLGERREQRGSHHGEEVTVSDSAVSNAGTTMSDCHIVRRLMSNFWTSRTFRPK